MQVTLNGHQLRLLDRVVEAGVLGPSREAALDAVVIAHAAHLIQGGSSLDIGAMTQIPARRPAYGPVRLDLVMEPVTGKAVEVLAGEVLRLTQVDGGTCVDYNGYNLHDYKEYLDCGFNRMNGETVGKGTIVWSGSPRGRPMYAILDHTQNFDQYYGGHRCNGVMMAMEYDAVDHPNCQDTFAEAIREYGLTPDDVHDSYNLWMRSTVTPDGRRLHHWNRTKPGEHVDLMAIIDTLSVPVVCGGDVSSVNNFDPGAVRLEVFSASESTQLLARAISDRLGRWQRRRADFRQPTIRAVPELTRDESYMPAYFAMPPKTQVEVNLSPEAERLLDGLLATGDYLDTKPRALLACLFRWHDSYRGRTRDHVRAKLVFSDA